MKDTNHIHKFKRAAYSSGAKFYFCVNDCNFKIACELSLGKTVECWRCGKPFKINSYSIKLDKPHCEDCHIHNKDKHKKKRRATDNQPLTGIAGLVGEGIVSDLKQRLNDVTSEQFKTTETKTTEIREFKIEPEEDIL